MYIGLKNRLTGLKDLYDEVSHTTLNYTESGTDVRWTWMTKFNDRRLIPFLSSLYNNDDFSIWPDLLIINSLLLHPTTNVDRLHCQAHLENFKYTVRAKIFPWLRKITRKAFEAKESKDMYVLWVASEDLRVKRQRIYSGVQVETLRLGNIFMKELIENEDKLWRQYLEELEASGTEVVTEQMRYFPRINYLDMTTQTIYSGSNKTGDLLVTDGTHKLRRRVSTNVPTSLWADVNGILNYFCNDRMRHPTVDCCVSKDHKI